MIKSRAMVAAIASLALVGSALTLADPGNGKGQGNGKGNGQNVQDHGGQKGQGNSGKKSGGNQGYRPDIDRGNVLGIVGGHRDYWSPGPALPPGIQKNLARGKPLPPGIAKKLDGRLLGHLPHYDGYEWQQVGTDLILVALTTGLIYEVLNGAFD
ncbi:protein CigR [Pseudomonas fluorescens]|uniref:Protein CigR n=1 Tax=Pseudomonas fluorescens TaxID=294 RepID=A0A448DXK8_PSEFL|nr:anti-virulence regulator CigR family protein [Pseudomonas fluorescens]VEF11506.1 protein CigR [Pseudomonas fluorescens]